MMVAVSVTVTSRCVQDEHKEEAASARRYKTKVTKGRGERRGEERESEECQERVERQKIEPATAVENGGGEFVEAVRTNGMRKKGDRVRRSCKEMPVQ